MSEPTSSGTRFSALEGARGILAWWVVFGHLLMRGGFKAADLPFPLSMIRAAGDAVLIFMVLSGFVIAHLVLTQRESYLVYLWRRFLRLYPVFLLSILLVLALKQLPFKSIFRFDESLLLEYLGVHLLMLHGLVPSEILPNAASALVAPAWSISLEWQFYLLAPPLVLALAWLARSSLAAASLIMLGGIVCSYFVRGDTLTLFGQTWTFPHAAILALRLGYFVLGIGSYLALRNMPELPLWLIIGIAAVAAFLLQEPYLVFWILFFGALRCSTIGAILSSRPLLKLGAMSYSTYLLHIIVISCIDRWLLLPWWGERSGIYCLILSAVTVPLILVVSMLSYRYVEQPAIAWARATVRREAPEHVKAS